MSFFFWTSYAKTLHTFMFMPNILGVIATWVKIYLKCVCGKEVVVQSDYVSREFDGHADR